jgi:hypothetical protein
MTASPRLPRSQRRLGRCRWDAAYYFKDLSLANLAPLARGRRWRVWRPCAGGGWLFVLVSCWWSGLGVVG